MAEGHASARLLEEVYDELRRLAAAKLAREKPGQTVQATALVHEAYMRLADAPPGHTPRWDNRGHFFAAAAEAMRRILIEQARRKHAIKHGGERQRMELHDSAIIITEDDSVDILALSAALDRLHAEDPNKAALVKLRHFAGLTIEQAAAALDISHATAERWWSYSRLRLYQWIKASESNAESTTGSSSAATPRNSARSD